MHTIAFVISLLVSALSMLFCLQLSKRLLEAKASLSRLANNGVPRLGGIAVFTAFLTTVFLITRLCKGALPEGLTGILAGGSLVLLFGLLDDVKELSPYLKLAAHVFA